ncbi:hypothetical protein JV46_06060 [Solemya velum gill symbiont]|uniref:Uncharacterized protein n=1 Tax=Solemya velum gill symbiont TaxID=2340 RepID=A0A0B0HCQ7_SOVGS|nr:hypothetical protein JV46_06060 [Solemya velum gill symbiont]
MRKMIPDFFSLYALQGLVGMPIAWRQDVDDLFWSFVTDTGDSDDVRKKLVHTDL